jgi:hypothetical protein
MWNDALPRNGITNWSVFYAQQNTTTTNGWLSWMKPAGVSWVYIFGISAGGGGAKSGGIALGGGGGGSGSVTRLLIPATIIPDIIYVRPGQGGAGGTIGDGSSGTVSYISIAPNTTAQNLIFSLNAGNGGLGSGGSSPGAAAATSSSGIWLNVGLFTSIVGQTGSSGALTSNAAGSNITFGASGLPITGGAGAGNGTGAGGDITGTGLMPTVTGGAGTTGGAGQNGFRLRQTFAPGFKLFPLLFGGGSGGGGHSTSGSTAGNGGNGSWGCGGGGGGGNSISFNPGNGGNGGDALILIGAF